MSKISSEKKAQYNKKYRDKIKKNEEQKPPDIIPTPVNNFFFKNILMKITEAAAVTAIPLLIKIVYTIISRKQQVAEPPVVSEQSPQPSYNIQTHLMF